MYKTEVTPIPDQSFPISIQHQDLATVPITSANFRYLPKTIPLAHSHQPKHFSSANMVAYTILSVLGLTLTAMASPVPAADPEALALLSSLTGTVSSATSTVASVVANVPALRKSRL